jgi:hypothetical protein
MSSECGSQLSGFVTTGNAAWRCRPRATRPELETVLTSDGCRRQFRQNGGADDRRERG